MKTNQRYQEIYNVTCCLLKTFKGNSGKTIVAEVNELMNKSPALRQFMFEFFYNINASNEANNADGDSH